MWLQNVVSCSHISKSAITWLQLSKYNCKIRNVTAKMLKVAVIIRNVTATFNILQSDFEICNHVTATLEMWLQFFKICHHVVTATFEIWLQNLKSDRKIRKYDGKFWKTTAIFKKNAVTWLWFLANFDRNFQHFAVTFRIITATFNILQSHFELWLQLSRFCSHISKYDRKMLKFAVKFETFETVSTAYSTAIDHLEKSFKIVP